MVNFCLFDACFNTIDLGSIAHFSLYTGAASADFYISLFFTLGVFLNRYHFEIWLLQLAFSQSTSVKKKLDAIMKTFDHGYVYL